MVGDFLRTLNSLKNIIGNFANNILLNLLRFVSRIIFIRVLSDVYLGVNGLLSNVLGLLALSELGISTAISYSLYRPLSDNNVPKIKALMNFYQKAYRVIAVVILILGLVLLPFLPWFIKDTNGIESLNIIYLIFLANMVIGYLFSYKRTLITADQQNYKIMPIVMFYSFLTTVLQISVLLIFKNYIIYLLMQSLCIILENLTVNHYINKQYLYLKDNLKDNKLDKKELKEIVTNVKALMFHKVGSYVLSASDNIIISKFIGIVMVGIYSNYVLIVNMINSFITVLINNVTASFGNLIAKDDEKKSMEVFDEMNLICFILYGGATVCFINLFNPFIDLVFGEKFVLSMFVVFLISFNNFLVGMNLAPITIQSAAGLYNNDRFVPLIQSVVNIIISVVLSLKIGIAGVLLGTLISQFIPFIVKPIIAYKHVFKEKVSLYFKETLKQLTLLFLAICISYGLIVLIGNHQIVLDLAIRLVLSFVVSFVVFYLGYRKSQAFGNIKNRIIFIIDRIKNRKTVSNNG